MNSLIVYYCIVSSYYQFIIFHADIHGLEGVQLLYNTRKAVFALPNEMETELANRFILKLHADPVGYCNGCEHGVERHIVENVRLDRDCVGLNCICRQGGDWLRIYHLLRRGQLWFGGANVSNDLDGGKGNARSQEHADEGCGNLVGREA